MDFRFGPARLPDRRSFELAVGKLKREKYRACSIDFAHGFWFEVEEAEKLAEAARDADIVFDMHAPFYIEISLQDVKRAKMTVAMIEHAAHVAATAGAQMFTIHPGFYKGRGREAVVRTAVKNLRSGLARIKRRGYQVSVAIENMGKVGQFGSLADVVEICGHFKKEKLANGYPRVVPEVDFGHIYARSLGKKRNREDFSEALGKIEEELGKKYLDPVHCSFANTEFGSRGERRHAPYGRRGLKVGPVVEALKEKARSVVLISESHDKESHRRIWRDVRRALARK